jgi:hypothetical protein
MSFAVAAVKGWFKTNPRNVWLIAGLLAALAVAGGLYMKGRGDADRKNEAARKVEVAAAIASHVKAGGKATAVVQAKAEKAAEQKEELINAVAKAPDGLPDESSVRWGCEFVRQQSGRPSDAPECRALVR